MIEKYNRMKAEIDSDLVQVGEFEIEDGKVILKIGFSPKENPILMGKIHKANALIREIFEITTGVCETIDNVFQDINLAFPEYFPKEMKPKKIGEMKQGAKDDISDNEK